MSRGVRAIAIWVMPAAFAGLLGAIEPDKDFSGKWILDANSSNMRNIPATPYRVLTVAQNDDAVQCSSAQPDGSPVQWSYALNGRATRYGSGEEKRNSETKWEGSSLLINTIVTGPREYTEMDRWTISRDRGVLTIERQILQRGTESEGVFYYRREGQGAAVPAAPTASSATATAAPAGTPRAGLARSPEPSGSNDFVVRAGTRIPLSLRNALDTKHSHEGDRVYLDTTFPVVVNNRVVIPQGSYVTGTLTISKPAGSVKGKGELFIRFDSLILPNGVTRDFRSRLASADTVNGQVDRKEGTITGERDKSGQAKSTAEGAGIGAGVGGLAGAAAGHAISGVGVGAAAGAAVGLITAMHKHRADVTLPRGTTLEMVLDRDLSYSPTEVASR